MTAADYRLLTEATGVRIAEALENVTAMVGPKGDPGDVSEAELTAKLADKASAILDTASGAIASFPDGAAVPAKDITIGIEPVQAGSGDPSPTNVRPISGWTGANIGRAGFNIFDESDVEDGIWKTWSGEAGGKSDYAGYKRSKGYIPIKPNTQYYIIKNGETDGNIGFYNKSKTFLNKFYNFSSLSSVFTTPSDALYMTIYKKTTLDGTCINISDESKNGTYAPYTGNTLIPISWQSEAGTVYGGTLNVTTGLLTVTMAEVDLGTLEWIYESSINSMTTYYAPIKLPSTDAETVNAITTFAKTVSANQRITETGVILYTFANNSTLYIRNSGYTDAAAFIAAMLGVPLVYELATPQTYQLTPTEVEMLLGENNVWADTGDSTVTYRADTKLYIQKINAPTDDDMIADAQIASGRYFIIGGNLYRSTTTIPAGDTITPGTNCILTNLADALNALNT